MVLIACSECGKSVSDRAVACPHCGNPTPNDADISSLSTFSTWPLTPEEALKQANADLKKEFAALKEALKTTGAMLASVIILLVVVIGGLSLLTK